MSADPKDIDVNAGRRHFLIGLGVVGAATAAGIYVVPQYLAERGAATGGKGAGKPAFEFTGKLLDGKSASLQDYKGRVLLLDFWSLGCGPCIMSMPSLQRVADKYADKSVSVVGVNLDTPAAAGRVKSMGLG